MMPYKVRHKARDVCYYVLAGSTSEALEMVTVRLGDAEGAAAWEVTRETPPHPLKKGIITNAEGKPVETVEY